eukprot:TRINITY_DN17945_c0_g1_i1.p1 TRINITY_DN17945_c0_g1~~TRINITY_DN17945_c0_g1_i1.p1  ORF type:complete len:586 (-),score=112.90 TRINITY_DN17945_c0_g1_i1:207-1964(-)
MRWKSMFQREKAAAVSAQSSSSVGQTSGSAPAEAKSAATLPGPGGAASSTPTARPSVSTAGPSATAPEERCKARTWNQAHGGQCTSRRKPGKLLCGIHQNMLDTTGVLSHGWIDGRIPSEKAMDRSQASSSQAGVGNVQHWQSRASDGVKPMATGSDSLKLLEAMRQAPSDRLRLGTLRALEQSHQSCLPSFISAGGLAVLERWLRTSPDMRFACLTVMLKLPVRATDIQQARLAAAVQSVEQGDKLPDSRQKAATLLDRWASEGLIPPRKPKPVQAAPVASAAAATGSAAAADNKRRATPEPQNQVNSAGPGSADGAPEKKKPRLAEPSREVAEGESVPLELPEGCPPELRSLDPRIVQVLLKRPDILGFLQKHSSVLKNMNADGVAFLARNLRNSKDTQEDAVMLEDGAGCQITVSNLSPEVTEQQIAVFIAEAGLGEAQKVSLPRESRRQRSCGVAFVVMHSREAAREAVQTLNGKTLFGNSLSVELVDGGDSSPVSQSDIPSGENRRGRRIRWKSDDELWDVAMFDRSESVDDFKMQLQTRTAPVPAPVDQIEHARFQAAASAERAEERKRVRDALSGHEA